MEARKVEEALWQAVQLDDTYCAGDSIRVGERSRADLALVNQPVLRLDQNTTITLGGVSEHGASLVELLKGALYFFSRVPRNLEVLTAFVNAGVEGTEGVVRVEADRASISIFEGKVVARNEAGSLTLTDGQSAVCEKGHAPALIVGVRPRDAVQWVLHYPPVFSVRPEEVPEKPVYRASQLLAVGRVDEAGADLQRVLSANPRDGEALALQSIIAVVQNNKDEALRLADAAVEAEPTSPSAFIALSYAQQARFDLEGARASVQQAVARDSGNALAWARLAELDMSLGELADAVDAAQRAAALDPRVSRAQSVLGFAYLARVDTAAAKVAFEQAIELDQADHLPRLGLGLAKIREGDLQNGGREIEIAVSLAPNDSLVRSYLGKTYFEEKRTELTDREYAIAKKLDPQDPTPWLYDAIQKQTTNRPVEALQDIEKSIALNDNRAVYRSRLLLDSDLAARSASLGRIYGDLGFQQLALVEGWKSVNTDPSNFSAHRFLADSYSALPRHEVARVSELLQSQLLQPLNVTPIQPRLAETNLFLLGTGGPTALSFNEFNPLFTRNGMTLLTTGLAGGHDTYAGEGTFSGIYQKASFSVGGSHLQTDGWRTNADQTNDIANAFVQFELSPSTSVQAEYRHDETETGDVRLRFAPDDFHPHQRTDDESDSIRLGFRRAFAPNSQLIGNFMYQDADRSVRDPSVQTLTGKDKPFSGEIQHLYRARYFSLVSGVGYFYVNSTDNVSIPIFVPPGITIINNMEINKDARHTNVYMYSYAPLPRHLLLTVGGSGDFLDRSTPGAHNEDQFNPKFGLTWNPVDSTTVRAAAFRTLKRTLITNQTLEPTQVAGFNQFFDDLSATQAWLYGVAVDQKFSDNIFGGTEYTFRDLTVPFIGSSDGSLAQQTVNWNENTVRLYLFWTPHQWVALNTGYEWERLARDDLFADGARRVETNRVPLGVNVFHPNGLSASVKATYVNQSGTFQRINDTTFESGHDDFWTVDATINYRLPKRYGFVTVGATNLFDQNFKLFDTDYGTGPAAPRTAPEQVVFGRITLAIP